MTENAVPCCADITEHAICGCVSWEMARGSPIEPFAELRISSEGLRKELARDGAVKSRVVGLVRYALFRPCRGEPESRKVQAARQLRASCAHLHGAWWSHAVTKALEQPLNCRVGPPLVE